MHLPRNRWPKEWVGKCEDPVVRLHLALYGRPDSGGFLEQRCEKMLKKSGLKLRRCLFRVGILTGFVLAHGREAYLLIAKNKGELVLVQEFLSILRNRSTDIEAAAANLASQNQSSLAKNVAMKSLAAHLAKVVGSLPTSTDPASQDTSQQLTRVSQSQ